jgi:uncharacterized protein YcfJ
MKLRYAIAFSAAALGLAACDPNATLGTGLGPQAEGAAVGAATGAAAGQLLGGDTRSTVTGAVIGGVGGGLVGAERERLQMEQQRQEALRRQQQGVIYR